MTPPLDRRVRATLTGSALLATATAWLVVMAVWLMARPYRGVRHDGVLYLGQALRRLQPQVLDGDLFFRFGSQDRFSLFSAIVAPAIQAFGITPVEVGALLLSQGALLWLTSRLFLALGLGRWRWAALVVLATFSHIYGGLGLLGFAEPYFTARTLAEPLALGAAVAFLEGRWVACAVAFAAALAVHPLIAWPVGVVLWLMGCARDRRWFGLLILPLAAAAAAAAGLAPFDTLALRYDDAWWQIVSARNAMVLMSHWEFADAESIAIDAGVLMLAWRLASSPVHRRLVAASLGAAAVLLSASLLGADLARLVIVTGAQQWRVLWWIHFLVLAQAPWLFSVLWRSDRRAWRVAAVAGAVALLGLGANWSTTWAFAATSAAALALGAWERRQPLGDGVYRALPAVLLLGVIAITVVQTRSVLQSMEVNAERFHQVSVLRVAMTVPVIGGVVAALLFRWRQRAPALAALAAVAAVGVGATGYDQRSAWSRFVGDPAGHARPFADRVAPTDEVYWGDELEAVWFGMGARSFFSDKQAGGTLFQRETALEYGRRAAAIAPLGAQRELCGIVKEINGPGRADARAAGGPACSPTVGVLRPICALPGGPRWLVFPDDIHEGSVAHWRFEPPDGSTASDWTLYDCRLLAR